MRWWMLKNEAKRSTFYGFPAANAEGIRENTGKSYYGQNLLDVMSSTWGFTVADLGFSSASTGFQTNADLLCHNGPSTSAYTYDTEVACSGGSQAACSAVWGDTTTQAGTTAGTTQPGTTAQTTQAGTTADTTQAGTTAGTTQAGTTAQTTQAGTTADTTQAGTTAGTTQGGTTAGTTQGGTTAETTQTGTTAQTTQAETTAETTQAGTTAQTTQGWTLAETTQAGTTATTQAGTTAEKTMADLSNTGYRRHTATVLMTTFLAAASS